MWARALIKSGTKVFSTSLVRYPPLFVNNKGNTPEECVNLFCPLYYWHTFRCKHYFRENIYPLRFYFLFILRLSVMYNNHIRVYFSVNQILVRSKLYLWNISLRTLIFIGIIIEITQLSGIKLILGMICITTVACILLL